MKINKKSVKPIIIGIFIALIIFALRDVLLSKTVITSILTGKRIIEVPPEDPNAFKLVERVPEKDGPTLYYEIQLKFSHNVSPEDFEIEVDRPEFVIKKLVLKNKPNILWLVPEKRWDYDEPYYITVRSVNPDKALKEPIYIKYEFRKWGGPPEAWVEAEEAAHPQTTSTKK
ncbi:hypothetical protein GYA27_00080 [candidate division WWE3 bacterium]|uniref:Uncharacterized protein n=1 Tax=candidate division WWE3 bacterium TaxID=2053526 RepID=A0A7X9DJG2_UNCKA|nr:hypothetical protein [candidate division WWE3 bacterium]